MNITDMAGHLATAVGVLQPRVAAKEGRGAMYQKLVLDLMARNTSIALGDHFADFVDTQVAEGRFASASEVVRAGLRLLEEHEARLKALRDAIVAGEASGEPRPFDSAAFLRRIHSAHGD